MAVEFIGDPIKIKRMVVEPFPIEVLPPWIEDFVKEVSQELNTRLDLPANAAISAIATTLMGKVLFWNEKMNWSLNTNLYLILGAGPASKKDAVIKRIFETLYKIKKNNFEIHQKVSIEIQSKLDGLTQSYESLKIKAGKITDDSKLQEIEKEMNEKLEVITEYKKRLVMRWFLISGDITPEKLSEVLKNNNGMLTIATPEASELFEHANGRYNNTSIDLLLKAWEGSEYNSFRLSKEEEVIPEPLLNLCLFTQPLVFDALRKHERRGLPQRFLTVYPTRLPYEDFKIYYKVNEKAEKVFKEKLTKLYQLETNGVPLLVRLDENAKGQFESFYKKILKNSFNEELPETVQEWEGKILGNLIKVMALLIVAEKEIGEYEDLAITVQDIGKMEKLYKYYSSHFRRAHNMLKTGVKEDNLHYFLKRLLELYKEHGSNESINSTVLNNYIQKFNSEERYKMLKQLEDHNLVRVVTKGRSMKIYIHNNIKKMSSTEVLEKYFGED